MGQRDKSAQKKKQLNFQLAKKQFKSIGKWHLPKNVKRQREGKPTHRTVKRKRQREDRMP